jgi:hypothetical protein
MGRLSAEDYATLGTLQSAVRTNSDGAEQRRLQLVTRIANDVLRSAGIDPTPRPDAPPGSDAAQAARFHRAVQDEISAFESRGRTPTEAEAYGIVNDLMATAIRGGWNKTGDHSVSRSDVPHSIEGFGQEADPSIVRVAGGDRDKDKEKNDMLDRLPGSGNRRSFRDDEFPRPRQIDPLAPAKRGGGLRLPSSSRPSPGTGGMASKPIQPANPTTGGAAKAPAGSDGISSTQSVGGSQDFIEVNGKHLPRPRPQDKDAPQPIPFSSLDEARRKGMTGANYAQKKYGPSYHPEGRLKGWSIDDVVEALHSGQLGPKDVYVDFVFKDGYWLMHNTRSPQALLRAGIPMENWFVRDMTGDAATMGRVKDQLRRNKLPNEGTSIVTPSNK